MTLTIWRNHRVDIAMRDVEIDKEEIYTDVEDVYFEMKPVKKYDLDGTTTWCRLILFSDKDHKGIMKNYVYVADKDTVKLS